MIVQLFWSTVGFLTRLPVPSSQKILPQEEFVKGIIFYPLVGLLVGLIDYVVYCVMIFFSICLFWEQCLLLFQKHL